MLSAASLRAFDEKAAAMYQPPLRRQPADTAHSQRGEVIPPGHPAGQSFMDDGFTGMPDDGTPFTAEKKPKREVMLLCGSDLTPEPIVWLWQYWLAMGKFHILAGQPGVGKTTIALAVAATITIGGEWPDGERCEAGMAEPDGNPDATEDQNDAASMLREELTTDCWTPSAQVTKALKGHGFTPKQIRTAGKKLNILRKKGAMDAGWYWRLQPKNGRFTEDALFPEDAEDALVKKRGTFGASSQDEKTEQEDAPEGAEGATFKTEGTFGTFEEKGHLREEPQTPTKLSNSTHEGEAF